ncbi:MAG: DNA topoisomerase IV subunit A [Alphaproteobacteria bacterium]
MNTKKPAKGNPKKITPKSRRKSPVKDAAVKNAAVKNTAKTSPKKSTKKSPQTTADLFSSNSHSGSVQPVEFQDALSERYLTYALSTIMSRSLPDARDGLKPVHRRLLYTMHRMGLQPKSSFRKSARIVGNVMGRFHPHGEASIYDALARMAQDFSLRWPLAEGQGNFGSIDGDPPAAMRYTEVRMSQMAMRLLEGIDEETVNLQPNYDESEMEPILLPGGFPCLLANGAQGIAVGMSCSVPPHNLDDLCRALLRLLRRPNVQHKTLMECIPGPDFPTGGELAENPETISEVYLQGRGQLRLRARWHSEKVAKVAKGGGWQLVVYEIPYQVSKSRLVTRLSELVDSKRGGLLRAVYDESDESIRLVLIPVDYETDPAVLMEQLYRQCDLEVRVPVHLNALDSSGAPQTFSLKGLLDAYLEHRFEVLRRRTAYRLRQTELRLELLEGFLRLFDNFEEAIRIIRHKDDPAPALAKRFRLNERQVQAVLDLRLRALRRLEEARLREESKALLKKKSEYKKLLRDPAQQRLAIEGEVKALLAELGAKTEYGKRRTQIGVAPPEIESKSSNGISAEVSLSVDVEQGAVVVSQKDWIRFVRGSPDFPSLRFRDGDALAHYAYGGGFFALLASNGRCYALESAKLPGVRGYGEPLRMLINLDESVHIVGIIALRSGGRAILAAGDGRGFITSHESLYSRTRNGIQIMSLPNGVEAKAIANLNADDDLLASLSSENRLLILPLSEIPELARGRGVILQKVRNNATLSAVLGVQSKHGMSWPISSAPTHSDKTRPKRTEPDLSQWLGKRAQSGRKSPRGLAPDKMRAAEAESNNINPDE